jgi:hypothetical protein
VKPNLRVWSDPTNRRSARHTARHRRPDPKGAWLTERLRPGLVGLAALAATGVVVATGGAAGAPPGVKEIAGAVTGAGSERTTRSALGAAALMDGPAGLT